MNAQQTSSTTSTPLVRYAVRAWVAALLVFLVWLVFTVASGPPDPSVVGAGRKTEQEQKPDLDAVYVVENLPSWGALPTPGLPFGPGDEYVLVSYGLQGLYLNTSHSKIWNLSQPVPVLNAQLIKRGDSPQVVTENVTLTWEMDAQTALLEQTEDGNNEADPSLRRRGDMAPSPDGLSFTSPVPVSAMQTDGIQNPYPIVRITAKDSESGQVLAESAAVVAVSPDLGCSLCHADAGMAILEVHDRHQGTSLQESAKSGTAVSCRDCHSGLGSDPAKPVSEGGMSVSAAIHGWHAQYLPGKDSKACLTCHAGLGKSHADDEKHLRPLFARDLHIERGLGCINCHGPLEDHSLALLKAEKDAGNDAAATAMERLQPRSVEKIEDISPRMPWLQEPDCTGCHDFEIKPLSGSASAFNMWTEDPSGLFSQRADGMAMVRCLSCHGAPHAIYPAENPVGRDRDNIVPLQYQQHARPLGAAGNCALCHMQSMEFSAHHPLVERPSTQIHVPESAQLTLPQVSFSHTAHAPLACTACHHTGKEDGKSLLCTSSGCHDGVKPAPASGDSGDPRYFRSAFHGPVRSCFHCHSTARQEGKPAGPVACKDCHSAPSPRWAEEEAARKDASPEDSAPAANAASPEQKKDNPPSPGEKAPTHGAKENHTD